MKIYYLIWTEEDITGLGEIDGILKLYTEIDGSGTVRREIGINVGGKVLHKCPSELYRYGTYGLFDNQKVSISESTPLITKEEFESLWNVQ